MADLTPQEAQALCAALTPPLSEELGQRVRLKNVSHEYWRWDLEARSDDGDALLRRVSCVRLAHEPSRKADAELRDDFKPALEAGLAVRGLRGYWMSFNTHMLPTSRCARRAYGERVAEHVTRWLTVTDAHDRLGLVRSIDLRILSWEVDGRKASWFFRGFNGFSVIRAPDDRPAQVVGWSDERLTRFVPPLEEAALAVIGRKLVRHGSMAPHLSLLVQLEDGVYGLSEATGLRAALLRRPVACRSVYVAGREPHARGLMVWRVQ